MTATVRIPTATGEISSADLGVTLLHEHVFLLDADAERNWPAGWVEEERVADAVRVLRRLKARGVDTLVDLTVAGLGRDVARVQRIAEQVDLNIVVATGLYCTNELPLQFAFQDPATFMAGHEVLVDLFAGDIEEGIAGTGTPSGPGAAGRPQVRAAVLKVATDAPGLTPGVERVLRATAAVHRRTGVPVFTHTHAGTRRGLDQQRILREEGVDLARVVIGHCGDTTDLAYLRELMDVGSTIGMDRFGIDALLPFADRVATVAALCAEGYAGRMTLSHDAACHFRWLPPDTLRAIAPNWHFEHLLDDVVPALLAAGVTQEQVEQMLVGNPRRIFETAAAPAAPAGAAPA